MPHNMTLNRLPHRVVGVARPSRQETVLAYKDLCKVRIALLSAFSAATGYVFGAGRWDTECFTLTLGVLLLAAGAAALNQYQERAIDGQMPRTRTRPIPSNRIQPHRALLFSLTLAAAGLLLVLILGKAVVAILGLFALAWYNGVYTYLKRATAYAVIPGALTGVLPPFMGWIAAGGHPLAPQMMALGFFFFVWQVAHNWLLVLNYGHEYEKAGLPSLKRTFATRQLLRITAVWMWAGAAVCILLPFYGTFSLFLNYALLITAGWLSWGGAALVRKEAGPFDLAFRTVNLFAVAVMVLICIERLLVLS